MNFSLSAVNLAGHLLEKVMRFVKGALSLQLGLLGLTCPYHADNKQQINTVPEKVLTLTSPITYLKFYRPNEFEK